MSKPAAQGNRGIWIRTQYFNVISGWLAFCFYMVFALYAMPFVVRFLGKDIEVDQGFARDVPTFMGAAAVFLLPFILLSILNTLFFGKKLCFADSNGLHYNGKTIPWNCIEQMTYEPASRHGLRMEFCRTHFETTGKSFSIEHFPVFGILVAKHFAPQAGIRLSGMGWFIVGLCALSPVILGLILALAE